MDQHNHIRDLLTLAAAGVLSAEEQRAVEEHLLLCSECRSEFAVWSRLTGALQDVPTPQAPMSLVERTRQQLEKQAVLRTERRRQRWLFVWLTVFAWTTTFLTWPLFQFLSSRVGQFLDLSWTHISLGEAWIGYMFLVGTIGALVVGLVGKQRLEEERTI
ncbi:MAG TPA: zf-HC2 domain-containing protein [Candidatus Angelobacter sp.]